MLETGKTIFEDLCGKRSSQGLSVWSPFEDKEEWDLAEWLVKSVGKTAAEDFLKLPIVHCFTQHLPVHFLNICMF